MKMMVNRKMNNSLRRVIFIASDVRSGSTLLENLLSNHPETVSIGELRNLPSYLSEGQAGQSIGWICSCGEPLKECPIWMELRDKFLQKTGKKLEDIDLDLPRLRRKRFFHIGMLLSLLVPLPEFRRKLFQLMYHWPSVLEAGKYSYLILELYAEMLGASLVVDNSKRDWQLLSLISTRPQYLDLKVIHLIRDGRAVFYSKLKRVEEYRQLGITFREVPSHIGWVYNNLKIKVVSSLVAEKKNLKIKYEDLCRNPETVLKQICDHLEIDFHKEMVRLSGENKHSIGGSPHRLKWNRETPIQLDERWKQNLAIKHQIRYWITAGLFHKLFGY